MHIALSNHTRAERYEAEKIKDEFLSWIFKDRCEYRKQEIWITIDKKTSKDLDDWINIIKTSFWYSIYISIADVAEIVKKWSMLDLFAFNRSTSVYTKTNTFHMFSKELSTDICSLNNKTKRLTITTKIDLTEDFNVIDTSKYESEFYNEKRFNYEDFWKHFNNKDLEYHDKLHMYLKVAKWLYKKRISRWWIKDYKENVALKIWKKDSWKTIASFIIQELMILNNIESAKYNYKEKIDSIYRLHMPEYKWIHIKINDMERAFYNFKNGYHYWLWENFYTHSTSPIRRYADLIEQRQFKSFIRWNKDFYNTNELRNIIIWINSNINQIINDEKKYNETINEKRILRFIKKLSINNYENIDSVSKEYFSWIIKLLSKKPEIIENESIINEILYRINNNLLSSKDLSRIVSSENKTEWIQTLFNLIKLKYKKEEN